MPQAIPILPSVPKAPGQAPKKYQLSKPGFHFSIFSSAHQLAHDWQAAQPDQNIFLQPPYLQAVEDNPPKRMRFSYLVFYKNDAPIGVAYCQVSNFRVDDSVKDSTNNDGYPCMIKALTRFFKKLVVSQLDHNLLVCGNLLLTGEHGFYFDYGQINKAAAFELVEEALIRTQDFWGEQKVDIDGIFIKDVSEEHRATGKILVDKKFREFTFHPNMVLEIPAGWTTFDDYMKAISSKYRVRAKRAFRMAEELEIRELNEAQIITYKSRLYELYQEIADGADFNMVVLHENYMPDLKRQLGDDFKIFAYYRNGEMVGYRTTLNNHHELEAHFLGFEQDCNKDCQIYLNMLYDTLRQAIAEGKKRVIYARTAMEIKSSVGAEPFEMYCYIRANNRLMNKILPSVLEYLRPPADWVPRSPFKEKTD
ncbi:MAG: GNAT family N-acetyltransferase [Saprospiraceae bacterium]